MKLSALKRHNMTETIAWIWATWFGAGCSPKMPGTVGSFFSLPLALIGCFYGVHGILISCFILFFIGWWATGIVLRSQKEQDPGFVVIDETVGQTITFILVASTELSLGLVLCGFIFFRLFDIIKIWPASYFDRSVHNAFGVMMDDVIAGIYAALSLYGISFLI